MFEFFSKKLYLVDYLEGFVDIHNHILPGIDDGAKTVDASIALLKGFSEFGVYNFIATPHIMHDLYPNDPISIANALRLVSTEIAKHQDLKNTFIKAAAEHMIDSNFFNILDKGEIMPIKKNYLLIEMSYLQASINFDEAIQKLASNQYFAILAHPERYVYLNFKSGKYEKYKKKGILFQLNILSLGGYYGKDVQRKAFELLNSGMIDYIASDVHNLNQLNAIKEIKLSKKQMEKIVPLINATTIEFGEVN